MTKEEILKIENEYIKLTKQIFLEKSNELEKLNLKYNDIKINRDYSENNEYLSELEIDFYYNGELFDIIEFFIFRKNKIESTIEETKKWILETIDEITSKLKK